MKRIIIFVSGIEGRYQVTRQKDHFEVLLKVVRNESVQRRPNSIKVDWKPEEYFVEKRTLDEYVLLSGGS